MSARTKSKLNVNSEIKAFVIKTIFEVLNDPDFGLELSEKAKSRLRYAQLRKSTTIPLSEIKKKYIVK